MKKDYDYIPVSRFLTLNFIESEPFPRPSRTLIVGILAAFTALGGGRFCARREPSNVDSDIDPILVKESLSRGRNSKLGLLLCLSDLVPVADCG